MELQQLGWNDFFAEQFADINPDGRIPGRVAYQHRTHYGVYTEGGELRAQTAGALRHRSVWMADLPAVGDWVVLLARPDEGTATITAVLQRRSSFSRKAVLSGGMPDTGGKTDEQVVAANIDTTFLVSGLDADYNLRRIERYLAIAYDSGASPVVILNKADLCDDADTRIEEVGQVAFGMPIHLISALTGDGLDIFGEYLTKGKTAVLLGSSGAGKSTIINALLGREQLRTGAVREFDGRGRHTTTHRELILLDGGGLVIDTPGMREIAIWEDDEGLGSTFSEIEQLAVGCRFRDCTHVNEPGCAVLAALAEGALDQGRYQNYLRLRKEIAHLRTRKDTKARRQLERNMDKKIRNYFQERERLRKKGLI